MAEERRATAAPEALTAAVKELIVRLPAYARLYWRLLRGGGLSPGQRALAIGSLVFIVLGVVQIVATGIICIFSRRYRGLVCPYHRAHPYDYDSR